MNKKTTLLTDYFGELHDARSLQSRDGVAFFGDLPDVSAIDAWSSDGGALKVPAGAVGEATEQAQTGSGRGDLDEWMADWEMRFAQRKLEREAARRERASKLDVASKTAGQILRAGVSRPRDVAEQTSEMIAMFREGASINEVAFRYELGEAAIHRRLAAAGVTFRELRRAYKEHLEADLEALRTRRAAEQAKQTSEIIARIAAGHTCDQIARDLGLDRRAIENKLKSIGRAKLQAPDPEREELQARQQEAVRSVVRAARAGEAAKIEDVARALGASVQAVRTWLQAG